MSTFLIVNNVNTTLAAPITSTSATTLTLSSTTNAPSPTGGQIWPITLCDAATNSVFEIVYCSSRTGAVCTITRGQEGTAAATWLASDLAYADSTAGVLNNFALINGSLSQTFSASQLNVTSTTASAITASIAAPSGQSVDIFDVTLNGVKMLSIANNGIINAAEISFPNIAIAPSNSTIYIGNDNGATNGLWMNVPTGSTNGFTFLVNGSPIARISANGLFNTAGSIQSILGTVIATGLSSISTVPSLALGDVVAQRSASSGRFSAGGTGAGTADYNIINSNAWTFQNSTTFAPVFAGAYTNSSDAKFKENITPITDALGTIMRLKPSSWDWISDGQPDMGFVAQDVQSVLPQLTRTSGAGDDVSLGVVYTGFTALNTAGIQDIVAKLKAAGIAGF